MNQTWEQDGLIYGNCHVCGQECNTHDDAAYNLEYCGDCGNVVCNDHKTDDRAARCTVCVARKGAR